MRRFFDFIGHGLLWLVLGFFRLLGQALQALGLGLWRALLQGLHGAGHFVGRLIVRLVPFAAVLGGGWWFAADDPAAARAIANLAIEVVIVVGVLWIGFRMLRRGARGGNQNQRH